MQYSSAELAILKLNPKISDLEQIIHSTGKKLTPMDIAAATKNCSPIQQVIARYKICGDHDQRSTIELWLLSVIIRLSDKWNKVVFDQKVSLSKICIDKILPVRRCYHCKGRKESPNERGLTEECPACHGAGVIKQKIEDNAKALGVSETAYYNTWAKRCADVIQVYDDNESVMIYEVMRNL